MSAGARCRTLDGMANHQFSSIKPTAAFVGASWAALLLGVVSFAVGLWNAAMTRSEKGFYFGQPTEKPMAVDTRLVRPRAELV